jgi:hypothetical protein
VYIGLSQTVRTNVIENLERWSSKLFTIREIYFTDFDDLILPQPVISVTNLVDEFGKSFPRWLKMPFPTPELSALPP